MSTDVTLSRRRLLAGIGGGAVALLGAGTAAARRISEERAPRPTNVVLLMADDLGWGDVGYYGGPSTPTLDAMSNSGLRFDRFYSAAPQCSPTRGSVMTGRHPSRYEITAANQGHLPAAETTLAELAQTQGWLTGHFGRWHLVTLSKTVPDSNRGGTDGAGDYSPPWDNGFEECFSTEAKVPTWDPMVDPATGGSYGTSYWTGPGDRVETGLEGDDSRVIMDRVVPFISKTPSQERPFLAVVWFHAPHKPVVADPTLPTASESDAYRSTVANMDREIGRMLEHLEALGIAGQTMVSFCSDNGPTKDGPGSTGPFHGQKHSLREGAFACRASWSGPTK